MLTSVADQIEREALRQPFPAVEEMIDKLPLADDQKASLWLLAWSVQPGETHRQVLRDTRAQLERVDA